MFQKRWPENPLRPSSTGRLFNREPDANKGINREKQTKFCYGTARFGSRPARCTRLLSRAKCPRCSPRHSRRLRADAAVGANRHQFEAHLPGFDCPRNGTLNRRQLRLAIFDIEEDNFDRFSIVPVVFGTRVTIENHVIYRIAKKSSVRRQICKTSHRRRHLLSYLTFERAATLIDAAARCN